MRLVISERLVGKQGRQEEVASGVFTYQHRVLADPAEAGKLGEFAFQQRGRVDHAARLCLGD